MFQNTMVIDGGLASSIEELGYKIDGDPLWSARLLFTNPSAIKKVNILLILKT